MGALLNSVFQVIYTIGYFLLTLVWQVVRVMLNIAVLLENVNQWIIENIGILVALITDLLSAPLAMMFLIAISALGAWYLFNTVVATRKWVEPSQLLIYGFITLFFFAGPTVIITQLEELRGALQLNLATAITTVEDETTGEILSIDADGSDTGLPAMIPDVMAMGAYENVVDPFDMAAAYLLLTTIDELDNTEFPQAFEAAYAEDDPTNASFDGFEGFTTSLAAMMDGFTVLITSLIFILPTVAADHLLRLVLTLVAVILYLGAPLAMLLAYFVYTNSFLTAYIRQYINLLIETFLTYLIISVVIYAMQTAARASIGLFLGVGLVALVIYIWRIASALKLATRGVDLFGGGMLTGGATGTDLVRTGMATAGVATAAIGGGALVAAASGMRTVDKARGDSSDPSALERDRRLKVLAGYAVGSSRPLGQAMDKVARTQGLIRTVVVAPEQQQPNMLDYLSVGNVAALNNSPFYRMGLDRGFGRAFNELGGRQRYFGGAVDPDEMGQAFHSRYQHERTGRSAAAYPNHGVESAYQRYRLRQGAFENRFRQERENPDIVVPPFHEEREQAYQTWRKERGQFQKRFEKEQGTGKPARRYAGAKKEMRYAHFAAGQEAEAQREEQMLARYAWARENRDTAGAAAYASQFDETLYQQMRSRLDKFDERFQWERFHPEDEFPTYVDIAEERAYQKYANGRRRAADGGAAPEGPEENDSGPGSPGRGPTGGQENGSNSSQNENDSHRHHFGPVPAGSSSSEMPQGPFAADENGLPVRVTQIDTNQDGQPDNWPLRATSSQFQNGPTISLAAYDAHLTERLEPAFSRLAQGHTVFTDERTQTALQQAVQDREIGATWTHPGGGSD